MHKTIVRLREETGISEKERVPSVLVVNVFAEIEHHVRTGIDRIKFDLLLKASLLEGSLSNKHKMDLEASIKRAYEFVLNYPERMSIKIKKHMTVVSQMLLLSNVPCSYRHF